MNNQKCLQCKECLDLYFHPDGTRFYICFLCNKYYMLTLDGLVEVSYSEFIKDVDESEQPTK